MPELPDIEVYIERLWEKFGGQTLKGVRIASPFLVRSVDPRPDAAVGYALVGLRRLGKRLLFAWDNDVFWVMHLMIAGRLKLVKAGAPVPGKLGLMAIDFPDATVILTEAGTKRRASLTVVRGVEAALAFDPGGLEPL